LCNEGDIGENIPRFLLFSIAVKSYFRFAKTVRGRTRLRFNMGPYGKIVIFGSRKINENLLVMPRNSGKSS